MNEDCCLTIKVGGFGLAEQVLDHPFNTVVGTAEYMAPEMFGAAYTIAVDSWAVGCILFLGTRAAF